MSVWWRSSTFRQQIDFSLSNGPPMSSAFTTRTTSAKDASARFVLFHIFAGKPRSRAQKQGLYRRLCARLDDEMAVSPQDVMVVIQFNQLEDWSFSAGKMADE
ncbi:tautomerase [Klebsiella pneumoniae]|uniref:Tautomerase n=1 Tax=Klebsiella pneumoniae TaxID=573 RepID=A0A447RHG8_KLEPN|nr:tautomerase [Klebsiella pneumoniae]